MLITSKMEKMDFIGEVDVLNDFILNQVKTTGEFYIESWNIELNDSGCQLVSAFDEDGKIIH